jgi:hypothetical protein
LGDLVSLEKGAFIWMLVNGRNNIEANIDREPFSGLLRKGVLVPTDGEERVQMLNINPRFKRARLLNELPEDLKGVYLSAAPPWERRF